MASKNRTPYVRVLAVHDPAGVISEYVVLERLRFSDDDGFHAAARAEVERLRGKYGLPRGDLSLFEGSARSEESFFRMFLNLRRSPETRRGTPG